MVEDLAFKVAGIKNLMKRNYSVPLDVLDLETMVNDDITMAENWSRIKPQVLALCVKDNRILYDPSEHYKLEEVLIDDGL